MCAATKKRTIFSRCVKNNIYIKWKRKRVNKQGLLKSVRKHTTIAAVTAVNKEK